MSHAALRSAKLSFSRCGRYLIAVDPTELLVIDRQNVVHRLGIPGVGSAVAFADQLWTARAGVLERWSFTGTPLGAPFALPGADGELVAAAVGPIAALWTSPPHVVIEESSGLHLQPAPATGIPIPLTARRWIVANGARVIAPSGLACELTAGSRVTAGTVVLDGTAVAVISERPGARELAIIGLSNGRLQLRYPLAGSQARIASRASIACVQVEPRRILVIDLKAGRVLAEHVLEFDVTDLAIDPDGQQLAVRGSALRLELLDARSALTSPDVPTTTPLEPSREPDLPHAAPPSMPATEASPARDLVAGSGPALLETLPRLQALAPRAAMTLIDRTESLSVLDQELRRVALRSLDAIAHAWDTRRLGYGNEGEHPYEHEVAALLGMNAGFASPYVEAAAKHLADHEAACPLWQRRGPTTPLGALAAELELSPLATEILLVVAAPALWSEAARLYGILANDTGRPTVDEALVEQLLGRAVSRHALAAELDARAPLVRLGVIEIDARRPRPFAALTVDPVILARLRREDPDLGAGLTARGSDRAHQELALADSVLPQAVERLAEAALPARIVLRGRPGSGRRTLLAALAAESNRALGVLDAAQLPRAERAFVAAVRLGLRRAQLAGLLPCVVGLETIAFDDRSGREVIADVMRTHPGPVAVVLPPSEAAPFDADHVAIELPVLAEGRRLAVWTRALTDANLEVASPEALAARYRIGPGMIHRAIAAVRGRTTGDATPGIERYIRQTRDARLGAYAHRVEKLADWDRIVLPADIADSLKELVGRVRHGRTVYETWGMSQTMATSRGLTALFSGPPGTDKTLVAGLMARELGLDLYQVDLSKVMSKWIGETERNLGAIFDAAEDGQVILLFDEADSLFAKRTEVRSSNDRYANLEVNYLLQRLDAFTGIAVLTTNASGSIDPAFKRRLSFRLSFPFPDEDAREELWRAHLPAALPVHGPLALDRLAHKYQLSGGYIRNACLRAAFLAAQDGGALAQHHLERAVALEFAELGKLSSSGTLD